ncbi:MAG: alpha/beta fold hydrolase, partial [Pseudomonadota bacterium]
LTQVAGLDASADYVPRMTENSANQHVFDRAPIVWKLRNWRLLIGVTLAVMIALLAAVMEGRFAGLAIEETDIAGTPVTLYRAEGLQTAPPVIVAHGFGGSRQMMDQIAVSIARQGFFVGSLDLPGHGRNGAPLSPDITNLDGTTAQLTRVVADVADAIAARDDTEGPLSFVGHSMATDLVIRAAESRDDVGAVVAISMYSPAVTATSPAALLVLSGATEAHLRQSAMDAVKQIDPTGVEGETVLAGDVIRRTAVAPYVGHVGVLYAPTSLDEITTWLRDVTGAGQSAPLDHSGWVSGVLLVALVMLVWPTAAVLPRRKTERQPFISRRTFVTCLLAPMPVVLLVATLPTFGLFGFAAFGTLAAVLAAWGVVQLAVLRRIGVCPQMPDFGSLVAYLAVALIFALALDRYGAAFLPVGDRGLIMLALCVGTFPLMLADTLLVYRAPIKRRLLARLALLAGLGGAMALSPTELGLTFTTVPVMLLFFLVYGTMAMWIANRRGSSGVAIGKAVVLAWAIAASTPLFATSGLG